jgi:hypothetical protein
LDKPKKPTHCEDCGLPWDPAYYDVGLVSERAAKCARAQGWRLSSARVLYILREIRCVELTKYSNDGIRKTPRLRIHTLDETVQSVIDYHKMRESIKRLGGTVQ